LNASPAVSVVVPVYNAAENLDDLVARLGRAFADIGREFEIVFVDDGSRDASESILRRLAREDPRIRFATMMRNYGQHNALLCGIRMARHPIIVTIDDDLQHPPEEIPKLLDALGAGRDVVYGTPVHQPHGFLRGLASVITKWTLQGVMGASIARQVSAFRAFRTDLRQAFRDYRGAFVSIDVLLTWGTARFGAVPVRHDPRRRGVSGYTLRKLVIHTLNMLTGFTTWPLQVASLLGFALTLFGLLVLVYVVGRFVIEGTSSPGFPFLASIIAIFSGAQLFTLGIIGEYMARMHFRLMDRPAYCAREESALETETSRG
jgi:glycosyltransferase involved in cell wall biosynthesis